MAPTDPAMLHLYYPDWSPGGNGCKNDGYEPNYMSANPSYYLSSTMDSCCSTYYGFNYDTCMGNLPVLCAHALWYPDWKGDDEGCINDGNEPTYMTDNAVNFMFSQMADCCEEHYQWNYLACTNAAATLNAGLYYPG